MGSSSRRHTCRVTGSWVVTKMYCRDSWPLSWAKLASHLRPSVSSKSSMFPIEVMIKMSGMYRTKPKNQTAALAKPARAESSNHPTVWFSQMMSRGSGAESTTREKASAVSSTCLASVVACLVRKVTNPEELLPSPSVRIFTPWATPLKASTAPSAMICRSDATALAPEPRADPTTRPVVPARSWSEAAPRSSVPDKPLSEPDDPHSSSLRPTSGGGVEPGFSSSWISWSCSRI
mmetsp:Transcript_33599/g.75975  ORF Transcript_33599/g.75975 Transcript_33599/m.75975 type:complete len:234 (+) Transcript_33599:1548-2249(+)